MSVPYRVLFSNDTTNIETCVSPYRAEGVPFRPEMLEATVDETAGVGIDVHLLQPGMGTVPWWTSKVYPFAKHVRFMKERFGMSPELSGFARYMADGGDMVAVFTRRCRQKGLAPFVSFRLNDSHGHEFVNAPRETLMKNGWLWHVMAPFHVEHPEWRLRENLNDWGGRVLNWAIPEVRAMKFAFIREIVEQYDLDGFELDFMRHFAFFRQEETTSAQRRQIMVDFIRDVRGVLDRTAHPGQHRWLCVRIPASVTSINHMGILSHDALGIDVRAFAEAGVEMFNLSHNYFAEQVGDLAAIRELAPAAAMYNEMCHTTRVGPRVSTDFTYDEFAFRRTTRTQFYTTAHLAYARGLDGVSTFNFVYYRKHGVGPRGPFNEPPFEIHRGCGDRDFVARQPQHYFLSLAAEAWGAPPRLFHAGQIETFTLDMAPPSSSAGSWKTKGWTKGGRLRIQSPEDLGDSRWRAVMNGEELAETDDRSEPYDNPYSPLLGTPEQHRAWTVPVRLCQDGINTIEITLLDGDKPVPIVFLDVAMP
jgi:hypothetical protein